MVEDEKLYLEPGGHRAPQDDAHGGLRTKHFSTSCKLPAESRDGARREGASPGEPPQSQAGRSNAMRSSPDVDHERALAIPTGNKSERTQSGTIVSRNQLFAPTGSDQNRRLSYSPSSPLTGESGLFLPPSSSTVLSSRASPNQRALLSTQESLQLKGAGDDVTTKDDPQGSQLGVSQGGTCRRAETSSQQMNEHVWGRSIRPVTVPEGSAKVLLGGSHRLKPNNPSVTPVHSDPGGRDGYEKPTPDVETFNGASRTKTSRNSAKLTGKRVSVLPPEQEPEMAVRKISLRDAYTPGGTASGDEPYKAFERCEQQVAERDTDDNGETNDEINTNHRSEKSDIGYLERLMLDALILVLACLLRFHIYALVEILGGTVTGVASAIGVPIGQVVGQVARPFLWLSGLPLTVVYKTIELMFTVIGPFSGRETWSTR